MYNNSKFYFSVLFSFIYHVYIRITGKLLLAHLFFIQNVQYPQPQSNITSDSIKYSALLIICIFGPLNKPISYAKYLFSFQYLTGVISPIVINQKIKIKSDHQDHGSSHCFRSRVHWDRYTILYISVYILRLIFQIIPIGRYKYFIPTFLCKYIVLGYFYYPPPPT